MYHLVIKYQITNETIRFKLQLFENADAHTTKNNLKDELKGDEKAGVNQIKQIKYSL